MNELKIIFMGTAELSCASLEKLVKQFSIAVVVTQPDKPRDRDLKPRPTPIKILAQKLNLPILHPVTTRDEKFISELRELKPDLIVVAAYGQILPRAILDLPKFGCLNVHTSLLPRHRGAAPIQWAIANGETETGVTIMKMDTGLDTGEILSQRRTPILREDDSQTLHDRLAQLGAELLIETIPDYVAGKIPPKPQPEGASYAPKIKREDGRIDWNLPAQTILNRLRAFTPWPGAFTFLSDSAGRASTRTETGISKPERLSGSLVPPKQHLLKIWRADIVKRLGSPGEILSADKNGFVVACGKDALRILELQREGGRQMSAAEFLTGHVINIGEKFP